MWSAIVERLDPARARPARRPGIEEVRHETRRGPATVMLRSPDDEASYLRLTPDDAALAREMDGTRTVAALVGSHAARTGTLAPEHVLRLVADLAANRMLADLPVDVYRSIETRRPSRWRRFPALVVDLVRGRRMVLVNPDRPASTAYRLGGRLLFTRTAVVVMSALAVAGVWLFALTWARGAQTLFVADDSYALGGVTLLALNVLCLGAHELGHALAAKHAGRRTPAAGVLVYFGIPSLFVDTTDVWMAGRRARIVTSLAGPAAALTLAGAVQVAALVVPGLAAVAFRLAFTWYLNTLFNLNPLMALDGYYALMDWLEIPNLRARGLAFVSRLRNRDRPVSDTQARIVAMYGVASVLWIVLSVALAVRLYRDRVTGLVAGLWWSGWGGRALVVTFVAGLASPVVYVVGGWCIRRAGAIVRRGRARDASGSPVGGGTAEPGLRSGLHVEPAIPGGGGFDDRADPGSDDARAIDRRLARRLGWALVGLTGATTLAILLAIPAGPGWSEIPSDQAVLVVREGTVAAFVDDNWYRLGDGDRITVGRQDRIAVQPASSADLVYRGGAEVHLCEATRVRVRRVAEQGREPVRPTTALGLKTGSVVVSTRSDSAGFHPLDVRVQIDGKSRVRSRREAQFAFSQAGAEVASGIVRVDGRAVRATGGPVGCADPATLPSPPIDDPEFVPDFAEPDTKEPATRRVRSRPDSPDAPDPRDGRGTPAPTGSRPHADPGGAVDGSSADRAPAPEKRGSSSTSPSTVAPPTTTHPDCEDEESDVCYDPPPPATTTTEYEDPPNPYCDPPLPADCVS